MPDTSTEVAIATSTLSSAGTGFTFSSIPTTYTDLRLVLNAVVGSTGATNIRTRFNSDTAANYNSTYLVANGSTAFGDNLLGATSLRWDLGANTAASSMSLTTLNIFNYAGSTHKTVLATNANDVNGSGAISTVVGAWASTTAINTVYIYSTNANYFDAGTTATLYGIL